MNVRVAEIADIDSEPQLASVAFRWKTSGEDRIRSAIWLAVIYLCLMSVEFFAILAQNDPLGFVVP